MQHRFGEYNSGLALKIKNNIYVDNLVTGTDCEEDAIVHRIKTNFYE